MLKFLTENFQLIESHTAALETLKSRSNTTSADVDNLLGIIRESSGNDRRERYDWTESDGTVPKTWKMRKNIQKDGNKSVYFLLPDGSSIQGRIKSLYHMIRNEYPESDVDRMREALCQEGWFHLTNLPEKNWLMKQSDTNIKMISPNGQFFLSSKAAIEYVAKSEEYDQSFISKIKNVMEYRKTLRLSGKRKKSDDNEINVHGILKKLKQIPG